MWQGVRTEDGDREIVKAYLCVIEDRVINMMRSTDIRKSCTATLLLLFAAIDGLGKLIHPDERAGPQQRFKFFLRCLGKDYIAREDAVWALRRSLVHNAINVTAFMSAAEGAQYLHLGEIPTESECRMFVNATRFFEDFCSAFSELKSELARNADLMIRAASRLEWDEIGEDWGDDPVPTQPPGVRFVYEK